MHLIISEVTIILGTARPHKLALAFLLVVAPLAVILRAIRVLDLTLTVTAVILELSLEDCTARPLENAESVPTISSPVAIVVTSVRVLVCLLLFFDLYLGFCHFSD